MKFNNLLKSVALASVLVVSGSSFGQTRTLVPGDNGPFGPNSSYLKMLPSTGTLLLSNLSDDPTYNLVSVFAVISAELTATPPATSNISPAIYPGAGLESISAPLTSVTIDARTGKINEVATAGGLKIVALRDPAHGYVTNGGTLTIGDIRGDLLNGILYARVTGSNACFSLDAGATTSAREMACGTPDKGLTPAYSIDAVIPMFTYAQLSGADSIPFDIQTPPGTRIVTSLTGLNATAQARAVMSGALALKGLGKVVLDQTTNFGSLTAEINLVTPFLTEVPTIPEPSTYILMGVGVAAIGGIARRRRRD